jgi:hypothetical protein
VAQALRLGLIYAKQIGKGRKNAASIPNGSASFA